MRRIWKRAACMFLTTAEAFKGFSSSSQLSSSKMYERKYPQSFAYCSSGSNICLFIRFLSRAHYPHQIKEIYSWSLHHWHNQFLSRENKEKGNKSWHGKQTKWVSPFREFLLFLKVTDTNKPLKFGFLQKWIPKSFVKNLLSCHPSWFFGEKSQNPSPNRSSLRPRNT